MWLHVPSVISACSRGSAPSTSPCIDPSLKPDVWLLLRGKPTQRPYSLRGWKRATWTRRLSGVTSGHSQHALSEAVSIWWSAAFPARTSALPVAETASKASGRDSSSPSRMPFATYDPATCSWRTLQPSLFEDSTPFSGGWPSSGSMRNGAVCERPTLARHISATAGGVSPGTENNWPTITVGDSESGQTRPNPNRQGGAQHESLRVAAASWPTPAAGNFNDSETPESWHQRADALREKGINGNGAGMPLAIAAQESGLWATPRSRDGDKSPKKMSDSHGPHLTSQANVWRGPASPRDRATETAGGPSSNDTPTSRLQLNERFVEALMGLPCGWTDCEPLATPSCPSKQRRRSDCSGLAPSEDDRE